MSFPIFASSELADFDGFFGGVTSVTTDRDPDFADTAIRVPSDVGAYFFKEIPEARKVFSSTQLRSTASEFTAANREGLIVFCDDDGVPMFRIGAEGVSAQWVLQKRVDSSWVTIGTPFTFSDENDYFVSMYADLSSQGYIRFYVDDALAASESSDLSSYNDVSEVRFGAISNLSARRYNHSECVISPFRILGARVKSLRLDGDGEYQDWSGARSDIDGPESSDGTFIASDTAGEKSSYTIGNIHAGAASLQVFCLCAVARARRSDGGPTNAKPFIRTGGDDYALTFDDLTSDGSVEPRYTSFEINPATSAPWSQEEINAAEIGVEAG